MRRVRRRQPTTAISEDRLSPASIFVLSPYGSTSCKVVGDEKKKNVYPQQTRSSLSINAHQQPSTPTLRTLPQNTQPFPLYTQQRGKTFRKPPSQLTRLSTKEEVLMKKKF